MPKLQDVVFKIKYAQKSAHGSAEGNYSERTCRKIGEKVVDKQETIPKTCQEGRFPNLREFEGCGSY